MRRKLILIIGLVLMLTLCTGTASFAADGKAYNYTIKIYSGEQGHFSDGKVVTKTYDPTKTYNEHITPEDLGFKLDNNKYYVRGFRVAGHDNDEVSGFGAISFEKLTQDMSYEVAYGIKGALVSYRVNYQDEDGAELLPTDTFYGMPGDKPVASFRYVAGYEPQSYNQAMTLSEDESQNVITFVYTEGGVQAPQPTDEGDNGDNNNNNNNNNGNNANANPANRANRTAAAAPGTAANPAGTNAANAAANDGNDGNTANLGDNDTPLAGPDQYTDLDGNDTPLADGSGAKTWIPILIGAGVAALLILALILYLLKKRREEEEAFEEE